MIKRGEGPWPSGNSEELVRQWFVERIAPGVEEDERSSVWSLCVDRLTGKTRSERIEADYKFPESVIDKLAVIADDVANERPVQYALGVGHFDGLDFKFKEGVLIPRPETEELVHEIVKAVGKKFDGRILDIGTGSGCIAIALKNRLSMAKVVGVDVSEDALTIARLNAKSLQKQVEFQELDVLRDRPDGEFEVVVSNPPYIPLNELQSLSARVAKYEPQLALFVEDDDPLIFYRRIIELCKTGLLESGGLLAFECHRDYASEVEVLLVKDEWFREVELVVDLQGNSRHVIARSGVN